MKMLKIAALGFTACILTACGNNHFIVKQNGGGSNEEIISSSLVGQQPRIFTEGLAEIEFVQGFFVAGKPTSGTVQLQIRIGSDGAAKILASTLGHTCDRMKSSLSPTEVKEVEQMIESSKVMIADTSSVVSDRKESTIRLIYADGRQLFIRADIESTMGQGDYVLESGSELFERLAAIESQLPYVCTTY